MVYSNIYEIEERFLKKVLSILAYDIATILFPL